jgi:hypothetical protein
MLQCQLRGTRYDEVVNLRTIFAALAAVPLIACADRPGGGPVDVCADHTAGWKISSDAPANQSELLALPSGGRPVREQLATSIPLKEIWLSDGSDRLLVCRYEAQVEVCPVALSVEFTRTSGGWSAGPVESRLCRE